MLKASVSSEEAEALLQQHNGRLRETLSQVLDYSNNIPQCHPEA